MADGDGGRPPGSAEKSLGDIVGDVSQKASLLVREEIELARAEVTTKVSRLGKGAAVGAAAGTFALLALLFLLHGLSYLFFDLITEEGESDNIWLGFFITVGTLLLLGAIAGLLAWRFIKRATPPMPELAIEEAKKTREAIEEVRR